jgi:hypothetical protein
MTGRIDRIFRKCIAEVSSFATDIYEILTSFWFWFLVGCSFISMYVVVMIIVACTLGINAWLLIIPPLIPLTLAIIWINDKRLKNYYDLLRNPFTFRDLEETMQEYLQLLGEKKDKDRIGG